MNPIDFVVLWVDGNDPDWQAKRAQYRPDPFENGADPNRFRDWKLLQYWFRGVEQFAPFVRKVFFVTNGQIPDWLNTSAPNLVVVKHEDFMPAECLPTFNSNAIEVYLHRIPGLSEQFVLFGDDMFLTSACTEDDFFHKGLPREYALLDAPAPDYKRNILPHILLNNAAVINVHFHKKEVLSRYWRKFFSLGYGKDCLRNALLAPLKYFACFRSPHNPIPHLKSTYETLWSLEEELLTQTGRHRFRSTHDLSHWLMKDYRLCQGQFVPKKSSVHKAYELGVDTLGEITKAIRNQTYQSICLNDSFDLFTENEFEHWQEELAQAMECILPVPSSYER